MARPHKDGVDYFPLDTDFFGDRKIQYIKAEYGMQGAGLVIAFFTEIYRGKGYYMEWNDDDSLLMSQNVASGSDPEVITGVLNACVKRGIFDKQLFESYGIITSAGIQRRFLRIVANSRKVIPVISEYWLLRSDDLADIRQSALDKLSFRSVLQTDNPVNLQDNSIKERKVKKSKVNKSKARETDDAGKTLTAGTGAPGPDEGQAVKGNDVPYGGIAELFNSVCVSLPGINGMSKARESAVRARYNDLGRDTGEMKRFFERVEASDFLTGRKSGADRNWTASFDWIMKESNFLKIREGNYDNRKNNTAGSSAGTAGGNTLGNTDGEDPYEKWKGCFMEV